MKVMILAGGLGTRLSEETILRPKPMIEIGGQPILWHIMKIYAHFGFKEFLVGLGYRGEMIKDFFMRFHATAADLTVDFASGESVVHDGQKLDWLVHLVDTGEKTQTGGRVKRLGNWLGEDPTFMLTYGDGVANLNIKKLLAFHKGHGKLATVTAVRPPARFGGLVIQDDQVTSFAEKPQTGEGWINGGFFVLQRQVLDYIEGDKVPFEHNPLERLTREGQLMAYQHEGFWQPMDTLREKSYLEELWSSGRAPWKVWP
jgi:glucose-1-phosphate cytidylyltransferase